MAKISVIGAGQVGAAVGFALADAGLAQEIVIVDLDGARAEARLNGARLDPDGFAQLCADLAGDRADELLDFFL